MRLLLTEGVFMNVLMNRRVWLIGGLFGYVLLVLAITAVRGAMASQSAAPGDEPGLADFDAPTYSSPIALSVNKQQIWVVNPDDDSVSVISNLDSNPSVTARFTVGDEPQNVALDDNGIAYVANAADNSVTVLSLANGIIKELTTGAEPWNIVASPDGERVFVANSVQDTITVIRTDTQSIIGNVDLRGTECAPDDQHFQPRGLAVTRGNDRLYVTRFLSFTGGDNPKQGTDDGKVGIVCQLDIDTTSTNIGDYTVAEAITLASQATGFNDPQGNPTSAYPNQLQSIVLCGNQGYLPNIAASPAGPLKFNVDTQAFVNVIDNVSTGTPTDAGAGKFINLHLGARDPEPGKTKLFFANPWAIAFTANPAPTQNCSGTAYVVSAGSDLLVKLNVGTGGKLDFTVDGNTTRYIDLNDPANPATSGENAGKNPLGIVIRNIAPNNNKAFVMNYISRNVTVVNLDNDTVVDVIPLTELPQSGSQEEQLHVGKEMFFSSRGVFDGGKVNRLSSEGWQNCASCHFAGLTDGNIWQFGSGPRKSIPMNSTWSPHNPDDQRILNYSAVFDEVQDFELNIRNVSGPGPLSAGPPPVLDPNHGLLIGDDGDIDKAPNAVPPFIPIANAGRPQLTVTLPGSSTAWPALDALKEWIRFGIRTPNGLLTTEELDAGGGATTGGLDAGDVADGRILFFRAGCQSCHGGTKWTVSNKDFTSPPAAAEIFTESDPNGAGTPPDPNAGQYLNRFLHDIGSFNLNVDAGNQIPGQPLIGAVEKDTGGKDALGTDHDGDGNGEGFNIPSLLAIWHLPPYYHNGACETLACVLSNTTHRRAGLRPGQSDPLNSLEDQEKVVAFLQTLDADTAFPTNLYIDRHDIFIDPPTVFRGAQAEVGVNVSLFGTKADLANLLGANTLKVEFSGPGTFDPAVVELSADDFNQDFGQATATTSWTAPGSGSRVRITVKVDSDDTLVEDDEDDNSASRRVRLFAPPPDRTPPTVENVRISDDEPFDDNDPFTLSENVTVKFNATDPASPAPAPTSGLDSYCIVRYSYNAVLRRWVEEKCRFEPLPSPASDGSFSVAAQLPPREGVAYAFVWVKDRADNISRVPGFDVISVFPDPGEAIDLNRNDVRVFRLALDAGQQLGFVFTPTFGDIDVSVFEGFSANATRCAVSANNGSLPETVTIPSAECDGTTFQIEVRAAVNSSFTIEVSEALAALLTAEGPGSTIAPTKAALPTSPLVGGPPALRAAIGEPEEVFLPLIRR